MEAFCFQNKQQALTKDIWIAIIVNSDHNLFVALLKLIIILKQNKNIKILIKNHFIRQGSFFFSAIFITWGKITLLHG